MAKDKAVEQYLTAREVANLVGVHSRSVENWSNNKYILKTDEGYPLIAAFQHALKNERDRSDRAKSKEGADALRDAQIRKTNAEAELRELEIEEKKGTLIPLTEALDEFKDGLARCRSKMTALPTRLALELSSVTDPKQISHLLTVAIDEALDELAADFRGS